MHRLPLLHGPARGACPRRSGTRSRRRSTSARMCHDRRCSPRPSSATARRSPATSAAVRSRRSRLPACVKACPAGALSSATARSSSREARGAWRRAREVRGPRLRREGGRRHERAVPLEPCRSRSSASPRSGPRATRGAARSRSGRCRPPVIGVGAALGGAYALLTRAGEVAKAGAGRLGEAGGAPRAAGRAPPRRVRAPRRRSSGRPFNVLLAALMAFGGVIVLARFALGLGGSHEPLRHLGLGALDRLRPRLDRGGGRRVRHGGLIYVFQRKDLYSIGRSAVLMGLLSYSFVTVTLVADLGLPWHFYQLALNAPEHSAMFEVSWCVGLYVTVLARSSSCRCRSSAGASRARWRRGSGGRPSTWSSRVAVRVPDVAQPRATRPARRRSSAQLAWAFRAQPGEGRSR